MPAIRLVASIVLLLISAAIRLYAADPPRPVTVDVDTTRRVVINGVDRVQDGLFGVDGASGGNFDEQRAANMHTASGSSAGLAEVAEDPNRPGQIDRKRLEAMLAKAKPEKPSLRIDNELHCLQGGPGWQTGPRVRNGYVIPHDLEVYGQWAEALVRHRLKTAPRTEHYFQFFGEISLLGYWNVPESIQDPRRESSNRGGRRAAQRLIDVIKAADKAIRAGGHDVRLGTPGLTNALQWSNWRSWRSWWVPMIDQLGDKVSFYGVHWYDMTPDMLAIEAGIVQAAQHNRWKTRLPLCIQESDYTQGEMDDPRNGPYNAQYLWALLEMPDKVVVNVSHVRDLGGTMFHNMFRADRRLPKYWSYWVMGDLRGTMRDVRVSEPLDRGAIPSRKRGGRLWLFRQDRGIRARAAGDGRRVSALVWNDRMQGDRTTRIRFRLPPGVRAMSAARRNVFFESTGKPVRETRHEQGEIAFTQKDQLVSVTLDTPADSIHAVTLTCDKDLATSSERWEKESFGSETMFRVTGARRVRGVVANPSPSAFRRMETPQVVVQAALKGARSARLRVALDKPRGDWEDTHVEINGRPYQVPVREHVKRAALCEVPVRLADLADGNVTVRFLPHDGEPYHVVWTSLVTSNARSSSSISPVTIRLEANPVRRQIPASARHSERRFGIQAGDRRQLTARVTNTGDKPFAGTVRWVVPGGWRVTPEGGEVRLEPGQTQAWTVRVRVPRGDAKVEYEQVALVIDHADGRSVGRKGFKLNTPVPCRRFQEPPTIDGDLKDWTRQRPVELPVSMQTDARRIKVRTGWDIDNLYFAAWIPQQLKRDAANPQRVPMGKIPGNTTALHVFLDLGNEKGVYNFDSNDHHFLLTTPGLMPGKQAAAARHPIGRLPAGLALTENQKKQGLVWVRPRVGQKFWQGPLSKMTVPDCPFTEMACRAAPGGYFVEAKIGGAWRWSTPDQALYGFWPQAGQTIGFDFVSDDGSPGPLTPTMYWGHGNETLHRYYVTHPREQVRGNPAAWGQLRFLD